MVNESNNHCFKTNYLHGFFFSKHRSADNLRKRECKRATCTLHRSPVSWTWSRGQPCSRPSSPVGFYSRGRVYSRGGVVGSVEGRSEQRRPPEEPDLFPMIYVNKVENLAGGPTRGMPRRCFRTLAGLTTPTLVHAQSPPHPSPTPTPANRSPLLTVFYSFSLSLSLSIDRCSAGIMILRRLGSQGVVYVESLRD